MPTLKEIWTELKNQGFETDKGSVHSYIDVYEEILSHYRYGSKKILEIGLFNGHSLRMWEKYFEQSIVHGVDCSETPHDGLADLRPIIAECGHHIHIFDATDKQQVHKAFCLDKFDVIIEDAGHSSEQQVQLYNIYKEYLMPGGIYIIEDIQEIDKTADVFIEMGGTICDLRKNKGRYDDVLVIFKNEY